MSQNDMELTASQKRAANPDFAKTFSLQALRERLPFRFPVPKEVPPSPKGQYRSQYRYLGYDDLADLTVLVALTTFEVALRLIDFSPLRDYLAQLYYVQSAKGQVLFDPVSLFLCLCLRRELNLGWRKLAKLLAGEHGAGWRRLFGFQEGLTPSASGLRYFFDTVGEEVFEEFCPQSIDLQIGEVLADAALGFQVCLDPIWEAGALRLVDIRAAQGDKDQEVQLDRGYNDQGHPICPHGYEMRSNGHDGACPELAEGTDGAPSGAVRRSAW